MRVTDVREAILDYWGEGIYRPAPGEEDYDLIAYEAKVIAPRINPPMSYIELRQAIFDGFLEAFGWVGDNAPKPGGEDWVGVELEAEFVAGELWGKLHPGSLGYIPLMKGGN